MILERVIFTVRPEDLGAFKIAFAEARKHVENAKGCLGLEMRQGIETPNTFLLLTQWETVEDHTVHFRHSDNFIQWRRIIGHLFAIPPAVEHYSDVL